MTSESNQSKNASTFKKKTANTIFFRYSPADISITRKNFESFFSDIGPVKKCSLIRQDKTKSENNQRGAKGYGFCKFTALEDAVSAANSLNETSMQLEKGKKVKVWVELADAAAAKKEDEKAPKKISLPEGTPGDSSTMETSDEILALQAKKRTSRVILRNLSFYATEHNIRQVMEQKFGEVVDINLPLVPTPNAPDGQRTRQQHRGFAFVTFANEKSAHKAVDACAGDEKILIKKRAVAIDFSVSKFQHKRMQEEEKAQDKKEETDSESDSGSSDGSSGSSDNDGSSSSDDDDSNSDSGSDSDNDDTEETEKKIPEKEIEKKIPENSHQHSLFLRNLPFDASRHDLFTLFSQYGHIAGIFLVKDRDTGIGKGTAFVKFSKEGGCMRAVEASHADGADSQGFKSGKSIAGEDATAGGGLYLNGRRIFVDLAVDKNTADSLKVERDEDGKPTDKKIGKDRRNLYLKGEGRVENEDEHGHNLDAFEILPPSDQLKRGRAHQEKSTKLRSPLFFINPLRLSIRNLAKQIDETQLKNLMAKGIENGIKNKLVTKEDIIANWRASGEMDKRAILEKVAVSEKEGGLIPPFDEKKIKSYIPSVFIDRDFDATMKQADKSKAERLIAPSRGFGFAEFTHHAHAIACLRELNNNRQYSAEFVAGGKRATEMKKQRSKKRKKPNPDTELEDGTSGADFVGDDGKVRIPRLIIEFTVENKAKARKQAENKTQQLENSKRQKIAAKAASAADADGKKPIQTKKKGRGAQQRAKKRRMIEEGLLDKDGKKIEEKESKKQKTAVSEEVPVSKPKEKTIKPPKKSKKKVDKEEEKFEDMVQSYKNAFSGTAKEKEADDEPSNPRAEITSSRWFD